MEMKRGGQVTGQLCRGDHWGTEPALLIRSNRHEHLLGPRTVLNALLVVAHLILMELYEVTVIIMSILNYHHINYHYLHSSSLLTVTQLLSVGVWIQIQVWL